MIFWSMHDLVTRRICITIITPDKLLIFLQIIYMFILASVHETRKCKRHLRYLKWKCYQSQRSTNWKWDVTFPRLWPEVLQHNTIARKIPSTLKLDPRWEIDKRTIINWTQEYRYQDIGCLYLGRLVKMMMSRDFGKVSVWYFLLRAINEADCLYL